MAATKKPEEIIEDGITVTAVQKEEGYKGPMVSVFLPKLEEEDGGLKVDQYEHVTIANEVEEKIYRVKRGERVDIPVPVFVILKEKYPDL